MARFDEELIRRLKTDTDIVALIESYGTKLRDRGKGGELIGLCPIHDDKNPSLVVNRRKGVWNCLGACGKGGDVIAFVMHAEKVSFRHAVELLQEGNVGKLQGGTKAGYARRLESPVQAAAEDHQLLRQVSDYYHSRLQETPPALEYLEKRGIASAEAIERFQIGFSDRSLGLRLPVKETQAGGEIRDRLQRLGVIRAKTGHEALRGCVTFPVQLKGGGVGEIYGRRIMNPSRGASVHWYLDGPHVGIWNEAALVASDEIILCESIIDALTFWCAGFRNVTCSYGVGGFTDEIHAAFVRHDIKRVLIAYDQDEAGQKAAGELAERLMRDNFEAFRIEVTATAKDINGYARIAGKGDGNAHNWLGLLIRNATWLGKGNAPGLSTSVPDFLQKAREQIAADRQAEQNAEQTTPQARAEPDAKAEPKPEAAKEKKFEQADEAAADEAETTKPVSLLAAVGRSDAADNSDKTPITSPVPPAPTGIEAKIGEREITLEVGNRVYRVRGLEKNLAFDVLKVNILARRDERLHVDTLDLYASRARALFVKEAARELEFDPNVIKRDLGKILLTLEALQDEQIEAALAVKNEKRELSDDERQAALALLQQPDLIARILADFDACGVVGEETNKLVGYLAATSRKLSQPLAVLIQSSSAAGKSSLMEAVLAFMPPEDTIKYSAMTGQSLFYMGGTNLSHRILAIAEEEGVEQAAYALKLLQSEGELNIASTGKDPGTGRMETQEYHVEGPVMIFLTTTSDETDPELKNRCVTLGVCEHAQHTEAIHRQQRTRRTLSGRQLQHERKAIRLRHQNAQRLLRSIEVVNNYAEQLTFRSDKTKSRRAHDHYLTLIESVTLLHQYQRVEGTMANEAGESVQFVETTLEDIELAGRLADRFLERSFAELPERTQVLLEQLLCGLRSLCESEKIELYERRFTRKDVRRWSTFGDTQLKEHLARLVDYEYLKIEAGGGKGRSLEYSLSYDPDADPATSINSGLIDVKRLRQPDNLPKKSAEVGEKTEEVAPPKSDEAPQNTSVPPSSRENDENDQADAA
jgi:DNA primase catalytic core